MTLPDVSTNLDGRTVAQALSAWWSETSAALKEAPALSVASAYFNANGYGVLAEVLDEGIDVLVVEVALDEAEVGRGLGLHLVFEEHLQELQVLDDGVDLVAVEGERLFELVEDADEIEDEAVGLHHLLGLVLIGPVHPGDGLH